MAKYLTTAGSVSAIEEIIRTAGESLTLVTPFIQLSNSVLERLEEASSNNILITLITRVDELSTWDYDKLNQLPAIEIYNCYDLHAKCYLNETIAAITSMNLYEFSQKYRREIGIELDQKADSDLFKALVKEIASIKRSSEMVKSAVIVDKIILESNLRTYTLGRKVVLPSGQSVVPDNDYTGKSDCHLPTLKEVLSKKYVGLQLILDKKLLVDNFPFPGIALSVDFYLYFDLPSSEFKKRLRDRFEAIIRSEMPEITCYWNASNVNVSPVGSDIQGDDEQSILLKTEGYLKTINYMADLITRSLN